ncbi:right-handed parallel beta-helix repeat-containing protein [Pedobacter heparinus]|uniref:right-handed parallel beta-helix repeat-containing protein n=1 Tax=Pedobacter heparinus TaxID=984 RepID=UPI00292F352B|nr:right-handed parallel beta-helix repeat-containing protein [Pedobacter heparinus]
MKGETVQDLPVSPGNGIGKPGQSFESYGLIGDGITDNTAALQKLIDERSEIYLKSGTYIINQTVNLKAGVKIYGEGSTIIKAGNNMSGTLLSNGRYFFGNTADQFIINRITFAQSDQPYHWSEWNNACIYILNSKSTIIENCVFDFHLPYALTGMEAVWISGPASSNNTIKNNRLLTLGIKYAENGADGTIVESNDIKNAYSNAVTANGNHLTDYSSGCQVLTNTITNAGRMAIEDWGKTNESLIKGNVITGTGKDPKQAIDGIALSAVGTDVRVTGNIISDSKIYAIEVRGNCNVAVANNVILENPGSTAIILNYTFPVPENIQHARAATVTGNKLSKSDIGIHVFGDYEANALIQSNTFTNIITKGISIESGAATYKLDVEKNHFAYTISTDKERFGVFSYTKYNSSAAVNQVINLVADTISYATSASGGAGLDLGFVIRTDKATVSDAVIQGNNNKSSSGAAVSAITAFGGKPVDVKFSNNKVFGAVVDLSGFINKQLTGNSF